MLSVSSEGLAIIVSIGVFLFALTLCVTYFSYQKWKQVHIRVIDDKVDRSWKDTLVQATILIEFFQFAAIAPTFSSVEIVFEIIANIFMMDAIKITQTEKSAYWDMLVIICIVCYLWFALLILIIVDAEQWLKRAPPVKKMLSLLNSAYLPFIGNTMFLPLVAILLDALVCDSQA